MDAVYKVAKNSMETICFSITEFKGKHYGDIRVFFRNPKDELKPSPKGLTISPAIWPQFVVGIERLGKELEAQGLLQQAKEEVE